MATKLKSPDLDRCETEWRGGSFMTLGPRPMIRCEKPATCVGTEKEPGTDGQHGSMSFCDEHRAVFEAKFPGVATFKTIIKSISRSKS
jgi:hypothetical protein